MIRLAPQDERFYRYPIISYSNSFLFFQRKSKLHVSLRSSLLQDIFPIFRVARRKLLISCDIELNQGPTQLPFAVLTQRLRTIGLRPLDVGGDGGRFLKAVSHQLCGTPDCHFTIRDAGIQYLREHPEEFIESNVANSCTA